MRKGSEMSDVVGAQLFVRDEAGKRLPLLFSVSHPNATIQSCLEDTIKANGGHLVDAPFADYVILGIPKGESAESSEELKAVREVGRYRPQEAVSHRWIMDNIDRRDLRELLPIAEYLIDKPHGGATTTALAVMAPAPVDMTSLASSPPAPAPAPSRRAFESLSPIPSHSPPHEAPNKKRRLGNPATPITEPEPDPEPQPPLVRFRLHDDSDINKKLKKLIPGNHRQSFLEMLECLRHQPPGGVRKHYLMGCQRDRERQGEGVGLISLVSAWERYRNVVKEHFPHLHRGKPGKAAPRGSYSKTDLMVDDDSSSSDDE